MWVVVQLLGGISQGDITFLHAVLVVLFRNLTVALAPVLLNVTTQLFLFLLLLGLPFVTCAAVSPRRISIANPLDLATNSGFVLILFLRALLADAANETLVPGSITVVVCVLCFFFLMGLLRSLYCTLFLRGKTYQNFLCHHKQGRGGFARLLKVRLKRDPRVKRQVILDSDNFVQNFDRLFGFPGRRTDTLVVLCTTSIILKPWCVGELSTAKLHDVDTILLVFPDFRWPTCDFVKNYAQHMEGVLELAQYGSDVRLARAALRWLRGDETGFRDEAAGWTCCSSPCGSSSDADVQGGRYRGHGGSGGSVCCTLTQGDARAPSSKFVGIGALDHS